MLINVHFCDYRKTRVCISCLANVVVHQRMLCDSVREGTNIMQLTSAPVKDTVLLTDSESDPEDG